MKFSIAMLMLCLRERTAEVQLAVYRERTESLTLKTPWVHG